MYPGEPSLKPSHLLRHASACLGLPKLGEKQLGPYLKIIGRGGQKARTFFMDPCDLLVCRGPGRKCRASTTERHFLAPLAEEVVGLVLHLARHVGWALVRLSKPACS